MLKNAAKTRKVPAEEVLSAFSVIEKAKINPSGFLEILGGSDSPGRTWMLIFTAEVSFNSHLCLRCFYFLFNYYLNAIKFL